MDNALESIITAITGEIRADGFRTTREIAKAAGSTQKSTRALLDWARSRGIVEATRDVSGTEWWRARRSPPAR